MGLPDVTIMMQTSCTTGTATHRAKSESRSCCAWHLAAFAALHQTACDPRGQRILVKSSCSQAVIIGGGYIGMELAASLANNGVKATIVFPEPYLLSR